MYDNPMIIYNICIRHVSRVGHTRPATWPQCHVVTVRWSRAPRQPVATSAHLGPRLGPLATSAPQVRFLFFAILLRKFTLKIIKKIKKPKKYIKTSEIHISQNTTPFNLKFSPLDHKFFPF